MEDDRGSRQAAKQAKKTIDETQALYGKGNLQLPWRTWRLGENPDELYPGKPLSIFLRNDESEIVRTCSGLS